VAPFPSGLVANWKGKTQKGAAGKESPLASKDSEPVGGLNDDDAARIRPFDGKKGQRHVNSRDWHENNVFHHHIAAALNYRIDKADHDIHTDCHHQQG
jgi:hypothetical protein